MVKKSCFLIIIVLIIIQSFAYGSSSQKSAEEIIEAIKADFSKIKDATADITLDYNIYLFGCTGLNRLLGKAYLKSPDKITATLNKVTYFAAGNRIRKIDEKGKKFYVTLINSLDFSVGFHPGLITHNFNLSIVENKIDQIVIKGVPKPGITKNVKEVTFYIDPQENLLRKLNVTFTNPSLPGRIEINYQKIDGLWVPVSFQGKSAVEINANILAGMGVKLKGENIKINTGLSDKLFDPGF